MANRKLLYATPNLPAEPAATISRARILLLVAGFAFLFRIAIALCSWGTTDTISFIRFALSVRDHGLLETYGRDPLFNHPPIPAYWAKFALAAVHSGGEENMQRDGFRFAILFRMPMILADVLVAWILWRIWRLRGRPPAEAAAIVAMYAWNPVAILVSGFHGNTDSIYASLSLLAVYLLEDRRRPFWAGMALGAAINVKLIPVLLIPPLALSLRSRGEAVRFMAGLALCVLPFVPPLIWASAPFRQNALAYKSSVNLWGVQFLLLLPNPPVFDKVEELPMASKLYWSYGRYLLLAAVAAWTILARVRPAERWDRYTISAVTYALFLVLAPGFGVQYLVVLVPLLYATNVKLANAYGAAGGLLLFGAYFVFWDGEFPVSSLFSRLFPMPLAIIGLVAWGLLIYFIVATLAFEGRAARAEKVAVALGRDK